MTATPISLAGAPLAETVGPISRPTAGGGIPFANVMERLLQGAAETNVNQETAVRDLALGQTDSLHEVLLQVAQADLAFRLVLEIRNRLTDAYQEIMKMQV